MQLMMAPTGETAVDYFAPENIALLGAYQKFLEGEHSTENLDFIKAVNELESTPPGPLFDTRAQLIINTFVPNHADRTVNLPSAMQAALLDPKPTLEAFQSAAEELARLSKNDSFKRFITTPAYEQAAAVSEKARENRQIFEGFIKPKGEPGISTNKEMDKILLSPIQKAIKKYETEMNKNPADQGLLFQYMSAVSDARSAADKVALLAERAATMASTGTPEEARAARDDYINSMKEFSKVHSANATPIEATRLDKMITEMSQQAEQEKLAAQKLAEQQAKDAAKSAPPEPKKPSRYENLKAKMTKAKGSATSFFSANKKPNPVREPNLVSQQKVAPPSNQQRKVDVEKDKAKAVVGTMPDKWEQGLDKRTAAELFSPLAESITRLNAVVDSPTATKGQIIEKTADVVKERDIYVSTLNARFENEAAIDAKREMAAQAKLSVQADNPEVKPESQKPNVSSMALLKDSRGNTDSSRAQVNTIYISQDGEYLARDQRKIIHKGKLEGITVADLVSVTKNDQNVKDSVIEKYNSAESQKNQTNFSAQNKSDNPEKGQGQSVLNSFQTTMGIKATEPAKTPAPDVPSSTVGPSKPRP